MKKLTQRQLDAEMRKYMKGRYEAYMEGVERWPYWQWVSIDDGRSCELCRKRGGKVFHYTDPIWKRLPPIHFGCRCRFRQRRERDLAELGLTVSSGADFMDENGAPR